MSESTKMHVSTIEADMLAAAYESQAKATEARLGPAFGWEAAMARQRAAELRAWAEGERAGISEHFATTGRSLRDAEYKARMERHAVRHRALQAEHVAEQARQKTLNNEAWNALLDSEATLERVEGVAE